MVKTQNSQTSNPDNGETVAATQGAPFFLKAVVIGLGVLLILGVVVVFSTIIYRTVKLDNGAQIAKPGKRAPRHKPFALKIDPKTIKDIALDGNRVAIRTDKAIIIIDVRRNRIIGRIDLQGKIGR